LLKAYGPRPGKVFSFLNNATVELDEKTAGENKGQSKVKVLVVQLFSSNSKMAFYKRSHLYPLRAVRAKIGLLDVPHSNLAKYGLDGYLVHMKEGGLAIIDGRLGFEMIQGNTVMAGFATEEELKLWEKMLLPKTTSLMRKIKEMESKQIGINVEFIDLGLEHGNSITSTTQLT